MTSWPAYSRTAYSAHVAMIFATLAFAWPMPPASAQSQRMAVQICGSNEMVTIDLGQGSPLPERQHGGKACHVCDLRKRRNSSDA